MAVNVSSLNARMMFSVIFYVAAGHHADKMQGMNRSAFDF